MRVSLRPPLPCDFSRCEPYEIGALIAAWMCWPTIADDAAREARFTEMCGWSFRQLVTRHPGSENFPCVVKPIYALVNPARFDYGSKEFGKRLGRTFAFGHDATVFLKAAATGKEELFRGMKKLTLSSLLDSRADAAAAAGKPLPDAANFRRLWRPSLPVIHIAAAWQVVQQDYDRAGRRIDPQGFFHNPLIALELATAV